MSMVSSYRVRMRVDPALVDAAMAPVAALPIHEARPARLTWWDTPALIGEAMTFSALVPVDQPAGPDFRSLDGDMLTFCANLVNPAARMDDGDVLAIGRPDREDALLDALSAVCRDDELAIVGGWQGEHSDDWHPLIVHGRRVVRAYGDGVLGEKERTLAPFPRIVPAAIVAFSDRTATIRGRMLDA